MDNQGASVPDQALPASPPEPVPVSALSGNDPSRLLAPDRPCANCPWRIDAEPGEFTAERYASLAASARDLSSVIFQCHKSTDEKPVVCAGFLSRGADHNLAIRMAYITHALEFKDRAGDVELYPDYRSMALANGVSREALRGCR